MSDRLILFDLVAAVQCKGNHPDKERWETIAAFDLENIADGYADRCRAARPEFEYRVVPLEPDASKCRAGNVLSVVGAGPSGLSDKETS